MIRPARQRAYENWRRTVPSTTNRVVFDSAFEDVKARTAASVTREMTFAAVSKSLGVYRPGASVLLAVLQELIDENVLRELHGTVEPRYAPAKIKTPDTRTCRRIWATDEELVAINHLLESLRCPA